MVVYMNYEFGANRAAQEHNVRLHSAFTARQMLDFSLRIGGISETNFFRVMNRFNEAQEYFRKNLI
ncbi:MAG: hypothetical protein ACMG6E_02905 [Candidatus Roizmanbacteria bacterium]